MSGRVPPRPDHPAVTLPLNGAGRDGSPLIEPRVARGDVPGSTLAESARGVLKTYCYRCHGQDGRNEGGLNVVTDLKKLVESKRVVPREPNRSRLLKRILTEEMPPEVDFEDQAENPPALPRPGPREIAILRGWIQAGAADSALAESARPYISELDLLKAIHADLERTNPRER